MDNQYSYYNPNETEGNTSNGTTFYNNGLTSEWELLKSSSQIWVSINTDDQGIFNIKLENEYAFIARALEKKVDENGEKCIQNQ